MKIHIYIITVVFLLFGCDHKVRQQKIDRNEQYNQLILNIAFINPDYSDNKIKRNEDFNFAKELILKKKNEIINNQLGLHMTFHEWTYDGGQSFPKAIVYVANNKGFQYAFPFYDEFYYWQIYGNNDLYDKNELVQNLACEIEARTNLEFNLNYVTSMLKLSRIEKINELNQFITLFADSLIGMKEVKLQDTLELKDFFKKEFNDTSKTCNSCTKQYSQNLNKMIKDLYKKNVRMFYCHEGFNSFWEFEIISDNTGALRIKTTFENQECYESFYW